MYSQSPKYDFYSAYNDGFANMTSCVTNHSSVKIRTQGHVPALEFTRRDQFTYRCKLRILLQHFHASYGIPHVVSRGCRVRIKPKACDDQPANKRFGPGCLTFSGFVELIPHILFQTHSLS